MMQRFVVSLLLCFAAFAGSGRALAEEPVDFNFQIRPILSDNCFYCHGPDEKHREADLRLDQRDAAIEDRGGYAAIVPGAPDESELVLRILDEGPSSRMPPPKSHKILKPEQKALLQRWIADGAHYDTHWAFKPVERREPPAPKDKAWPKNEADRFVLAALEKRGLAPSADADPATLIRRLSLDLTGLLPTPEEVRAFETDKRPDAYEQLVDRLLASPHYGERWGRHWLDQARYADSNGYTIDSERTMWPYRDWVIRALNDDMPFDQFTVEQLAGDLLPNPTRAQLIATAFHRNTMINEEGGVDREQFRNEIVSDRTSTTGSVWMGLTVGCAQCHSHKFDPISHKEYYQLFAFFNQGSDENNNGETMQVAPGENLGDPPPQPDAGATARVQALKNSASERQQAWERHVAQNTPAAPQWAPLAIESFRAASNRTLQSLPDGSILAAMDGAPNDTYEITATLPTQKLAALRLSVLPHDTLPNRGAGTAANGNFVLTEIELLVDGTPTVLSHAVADHQKQGYAVNAAIDGRKDSGWALEMGQGGQGPHEAWFYLDKPTDVAGKPLTLRLRHDVNDHYLIGRFAMSGVDIPPATHPDQRLWDSALIAARKPAPDRTAVETAQLATLFHAMDLDLAKAEREVGRLDTLPFATLLVMRDVQQPRETFIQLRGDFLNPDRATGDLSPDTPACLPPLNAQGGANRLDLARWLVRNDNPLTPRVAVNRVWMHYFGQGLVETENDFGTQGAPPTHPELLDWLASEFVREGWSMKKLHRLIVLSATYRQASRYRPELANVDPQNLLLGRQNRLRLDAEIIRDAALSASGMLNPALGGPPVHPPQPEGVYSFTQTNKQWAESQGPDRYRRAIYTAFIRSAPYPLFTTFDTPNLSTTCTRRGRSNTPLQALNLANDRAFIELAQGLALRLWKETPGAGAEADRARVARAFQICYSREPTAREADAVLAYVRRQTEKFSADRSAASAAAPAGRPSDMAQPVAAAWSAAARGLMNTDEFITRE